MKTILTHDPQAYLFQKRSLTLHGHKTSVSLEKAFWDVLEQAARFQNISLSQLVKNIDENRKGNLASALRLYALEYVRRKKTPEEPYFLQPVSHWIRF